MSILRRIFKIGQAEAHSAVDKLENPIKLTEQGIRDLKTQLDNSLQALAEVKALAIRSRNEMTQYMEKSKDFESKAVTLLKKIEKGELDKTDGERLATEALVKKEENTGLAAQKKSDVEKFEQNVATLDANIKKLKSKVSSYENELKTLKARVTVSSATKNINKQMSQIDSSGTISMLERMKEKVEKEEALSEAYGEMANESKSLEDEIDSAIGDDKQVAASDALADLKNKLGMKEEQT